MRAGDWVQGVEGAQGWRGGEWDKRQRTCEAYEDAARPGEKGWSQRAPGKTGEGMGVLCSETEPGARDQPPTRPNLRQPGLLQLLAAEIQVKPA